MSSRIQIRIQQQLAAGLGLFDASVVRLPARGAAAGVYHPGEDVPCAAGFGRLLGVPFVQSVLRRGDWLLFTFTDAFYSACVEQIRIDCPAVDADGGRLAVNRLLTLSRTGGTGCPADAAVQNMLLLCLCADLGNGAFDRAERAVLSLFTGLPPAERAAHRAGCGAVGDACARLLRACLST